MEVIENKFLKITINKFGATLTSIVDKKRNNFELMYQVNKNSWEYQDVQMFPLIGNGEYSYMDKDYKMSTRHGFLRNLTFDVLLKQADTLVLGVKANNDTKKYYPFDFDFKIKYKLVKNKLIVSIEIDTNKTTYYSYGSHTAFRINENANVVFAKETRQFELEKDLIDLQKISLKKEISLQKLNIFEKNHTIVLENRAKNIYLYNGFGYQINYRLSSSLFAVWTKPETLDFVCIEPWWGISNYKNESKDLANRLYINKGNNKFKYSFSFNYIN